MVAEKKKADAKAEVVATSKELMQQTMAKHVITVETMKLKLWRRGDAETKGG
jgi:hypothetical protein